MSDDDDDDDDDARARSSARPLSTPLARSSMKVRLARLDRLDRRERATVSTDARRRGGRGGGRVVVVGWMDGCAGGRAKPFARAPIDRPRMGVDDASSIARDA